VKEGKQQERSGSAVLYDLLISSVGEKREEKKDESGAIFSRIFIATRPSSILYRIALMFA